MRRRLGGLALVLAWASAAAAQDDPLKQALALEESIQKVIAKAEPSIACILVSRSDGYAKFGQGPDPTEPGKLGGFSPPDPGRGFHRDTQREELANRLNLAMPPHVSSSRTFVPDSYGSGVVIDRSGLILTNFHVVRDATKVYVRLPGKPGSYADIHAADERSDLAVLKLLQPPSNLTALVPGDADSARKGQFVLALANPFAAGFRDGSPSVSWSMLSNVRRRVPGEPNEVDRRRPRLHYYGVLFQTDFRLNLGCSGGALLDLKGNWIGLTTTQAGVAGGESSGGFALPLDRRMKKIINELEHGREMEYGFLGISLNTQRPDGLPADFVSIGQVSSNGPAARAGLNPGDRIVKIDGYDIRDLDDLYLNIAVCPAGTAVRLTAQTYRGTRDTEVSVAKAWWPATGPVIAANRPKPVHGLRVDWTSTLIRNQFFDSRIAPGVLVREVSSNSPAGKAGLKADSDVIIEVNGKSVNSPKEFYEAAAQSGGRVEMILAESGRKVILP